MIENRVEEHAQEAYRALQSHFPAFCGCEMCKADVLVYALNRLPARYVASEEGRVITELNLDKNQNRVSIDVALMEGIPQSYGFAALQAGGSPEAHTLRHAEGP